MVRGGAKVAAKQIPFLFTHRADVLVGEVSSERLKPWETHTRAHTLTWSGGGGGGGIADITSKRGEGGELKTHRQRDRSKGEVTRSKPICSVQVKRETGGLLKCPQIQKAKCVALTRYHGASNEQQTAALSAALRGESSCPPLTVTAVVDQHFRPFRRSQTFLDKGVASTRGEDCAPGTSLRERHVPTHLPSLPPKKVDDGATGKTVDVSS